MTAKPPVRLWPAVLAVWALLSAMLLVVGWEGVAGMRFHDGDDAMRLLQVRDWLAGQSWWDVGQRRLNGGDFAMHWSRLVDLPLAAVALTAWPFVGVAGAERVMMAVVPLLTLLGVMAGAAALVRRMLGEAAAIVAIPLAPLSLPILMQVSPGRIDHHGWQIALALAAACALAGRPGPRGGAPAGLALAALLTVSLEGFPITAAYLGVAGLAWAWNPERWRGFVVALAGALFGAAALLHAATRGPGMLAHACDAVSPAWLSVLGVGAAGLAAATTMGRARLSVRLAALAAAGAGAGATLLLVAPDCLRGPFATLDPLTYRLWYLNVPEGMPVWRQELGWAATALAMPVLGLVGYALAWRRAKDAEARERWALLGLLALAALLCSVLVIRAAGTANALALPGAAAVMLALLSRARAVRPMLPRVLATVAALGTASPSLAVGLAASRFGNAPAPPSRRAACSGTHDLRALARLPAATVFAPVDASPDLVATTPHRAVAGPYHRNTAAIGRVFAAFTAPPARAEPLVRATGARYVAVCPGLSEPALYARGAPDGLWARLDRGERVPWLRSVPLPGSRVRVWQVRQPLPGDAPPR